MRIPIPIPVSIPKVLRALVGVAVAGTLALGLLPAAPAQAATSHGCPSGNVCLYPNASWNGDKPSLTFLSYGAHNLSNQLGSHRVFNNQTGGATVRLCTGYNGSGCGTAYAPGWVGDVNLTPINSVTLSPPASTNNQKAAFDYFVSVGYTKAQSAGIVGNLMQESGTTINPRAVQSNGVGHGIAQWSHPGRWDSDTNDNVVWFARARGLDPWSLSAQLQFTRYELDTFSHYGKASLRATTTVKAAADAFEVGFEKCGCDHPQREAYAQQVYNAYA